MWSPSEVASEARPDAGVRFGLRHPACVGAGEVAEFARQAELAGFETAWFPDSQFLWRELWATMAIATTTTERIGLGSAVTNFETRNVSVTAAAVSTIEELAPGRVRLGVGTGDSAIKTLGLRPTRLARMREQVALLRELLSGSTVAWGEPGEAYGVRRMRVRSAPGHPVPIYMAATGPKALELAGEIADGVIIIAGIAPSLIERAVGLVRRGAEAAGRTLDEIDLWLGAHTAVATDEREAARLVKPLCLSAAQIGGSGALRSVGIEVSVPPVVEGIYPDVTHAEDWEAAIAAADRYIDDEIARRYAESFTLAGPPDLLRERIDRAVELGIRGFYILGYSSYELPVAALRAFGEEIIPRYSPRPRGSETAREAAESIDEVSG